MFLSAVSMVSNVTFATGVSSAVIRSAWAAARSANSRTAAIASCASDGFPVRHWIFPDHTLM